MRSILLAHTRGIYCGSPVVASTPPPAPTSLSVSISGSTAQLTWAGGAGQTVIERKTDWTDWAVVATTADGAHEYNNVGLSNGTYYWRAWSLAGGLASLGPSNTVTGTVSGLVYGASLSGGILTLSGIDFAVKTRAAPAWWDNFASGTVGATLNGRAPVIDNANATDLWSGTQRGTGNRPYFTLTGNRVSGKPSAIHELSGNNYNCSLDVRHQLPDAVQPIYASWWWKCNPSASPRQVKPFAIYGNRDGTTPEFYLGMGNYEARPDLGYPSTDGALRTSTQDPGITNVLQYGPINFGSVLNRFIKFELILIQSDQATANGFYALRIYDPNNPSGPETRTVSRANIATRGVGGSSWRQFCFGHYNGGWNESPVHTDDILLDDDANHARIVLCESSNYSACTRSEDQPGISWNSSEIRCTYNRGGFSVGDTAHAFVVTGAGHSGHGASTYAGEITIQ